MSSALALAAAIETKWTVVSGAMKGSVRLMNTATFTIGRSPECEFLIINDPKCSRRHAQVGWNERGLEITCLNEANPVLVNGREILSALLNDGDILTLGDTEIMCNLTTAGAGAGAMVRADTSPLSLVDPGAVEAPPYPAHFGAPTRVRSTPSRTLAKPSNPGRLAIYVGLAIVVLWFFTGNDSKKKKELTLRTEQQIQTEIDTANKLAEAAQNMPQKRFEDMTNPARQAQENFVRGFRDYRKGQFERSIDSFQACLALDPNHALCNRLWKLANRRFDELVQYEIVLGRKYRDQNQFRACRSSFRNVMVMVKDKNSAIYREAKANYDACNSLVEGRY